MPSLYHFNSDQFKENLILGGQQHMVAGRLCQYLKGWQLDGIRFLYKHFEKGESCILNDESGLGKVVTTSVFLGAILSNDTTKKCLIIVRDDEYIEGWRFHLSVLTQLSVKVIERTSDINHETVFLIKWSTIKDIGQISKTTFDHIIVDNRGEMLTNRFCTGILLRYYETKVSIVISSSDVTSDVNLLHILLRLCGRLDKQYADIKIFEDKFQLPALKEGVCNKIDLEDYFLKREKVINFCREFRLRRYRHQFEEQFPLVPCNDFKRHLQQWRNSSNSQSSGSAKLCSSSSEKDVEELFQVYFRIKQERNDRKKDCEQEKQTECNVAYDNRSNSSDELFVMSPLLYVSESDSDNEETQLRNEPSTALPSDEIKQEEENIDGKGESKSEKEIMSLTINRRKLTKPVKKSTQSAAKLRSDKSLRSRKVVASGSKQTEKSEIRDSLKNSPKKRGRPVGKKSVQIDNSVKQSKKESFSTKEESKSERESKEKTTNKVNSKSDKSEAKRKDLAADSSPSKMKGSQDNEKKTKRNPLNAESTSKKNDKILTEQSKNKDAVTKTTECAANAKTGKADDVNKVADKPQNSKTSEKKDLKKIYRDNGKRKVDENKGAVAPRRSRSKLVEENDAFSGAVKVKKKKPNDDSSKTKQLKEEENQRRRAKYAKKPEQENHPAKISKKVPRNVQLDLVMEEANKFLKIKNTSATKSTNRTTRTSEKSPLHDKSRSSLCGRPSKQKKTRNSSKKSIDSNTTSPNGLKQEKGRSETPRRHKPLTVYTLLGVHSRSTRGMQRYTRSSSIQNKYMKVLEAQVGLDKLSKAKRHPLRRQSVAVEKAKPPAEDSKPDTSCFSETWTILESMQLGQALTPTNGCTTAEFSAPIPKKVGYNFPLMLDKEVPDSECVITSQNSNRNEVIILSGSSTASSECEMEPPKSALNRRTSSMKPPMVTIPRQSHNKAKSPDLFSTCSDLSLPCSQQKNSKSTFDGFKIFGSEVRQHLSSTLSEGANRITQPYADCLPPKNDPALRKELQSSPTNHPIEDEDAMFEITTNGTFSNMIRVNSNGEMSPIRNKNQSTPPSVSHQKNRITNYLISSNQQVNGTSPSPSLDDQIDNLQKTPKRRKSLSGTMKRSPRGINGGPKTQSTKLTQWLIKNSPVVRISDKPLKASSAKRRRLDLLFPDDK